MIDYFDYNLIEETEGIVYLHASFEVIEYFKSMLNYSILSDYLIISYHTSYNNLKLEYGTNSIINIDIIESYLKIIIDRYKKLNEDYKQEYNNEEDLIHV